MELKDNFNMGGHDKWYYPRLEHLAQCETPAQAGHMTEQFCNNAQNARQLEHDFLSLDNNQEKAEILFALGIMYLEGGPYPRCNDADIVFEDSFRINPDPMRIIKAAHAYFLIGAFSRAMHYAEYAREMARKEEYNLIDQHQKVEGQGQDSTYTDAAAQECIKQIRLLNNNVGDPADFIIRHCKNPNILFGDAQRTL